MPPWLSRQSLWGNHSKVPVLPFRRRHFRWPVSVVQRIAAPAGKVWDTISMPGNLEPCHPFCAKNPVEIWPGSKSRDQVHYLNGLVYQRQFRRWIAGIGYDLNFGRSGERTSFVSWRIQPIDSSQTDLRISVYPHVILNLPAAIRWIPYVVHIRPLLRKYLSSVTKGFEWYVTRNEPVPRNHFGPHQWFSERGSETRPA